jgi:outer membrane protein
MPKLITKRLALSLLPLLTLPNFPALADQVANFPAGKAVTEKSSSQSFTLDQAIDYALANNPDLQIAIERIG